MVRTRATPAATAPATWGDVVVLPENRAAVRAAQLLAHNRVTAAQPLVLHGPPGVGKTVIINSLVSAVVESPAGRSIRSCLAAELPRTSDAEDFDDLKSCDLLVIEDLQHLPARDILAVCQLLDHRAARKLPTVVTATSGPANLSSYPRRLTNRLTPGLVVRMDVPGVASRRRLMEHFAAARKVRLCPDAIDWLARAADGIRPLIGFAEKLRTVAKGYPTPLTAAQVQEWLLEPSAGESKSRLQRIVTRVAAVFKQKPKELVGASRLRSILLPRQVAMSLARDLTRLPLADIGKHFGGRDHTTVMHAVRRVEALALADATLAGRIRELRAELE